jgi:hypothetical protein
VADTATEVIPVNQHQHTDPHRPQALTDPRGALALTGTAGHPAAAGYRHEPQGGFCTICGSVWPCARGTRTELGLRPAA